MNKKELERQIKYSEHWLAEMIACALSGKCELPDKHQAGIDTELERLARLKAKQHSSAGAVTFEGALTVVLCIMALLYIMRFVPGLA
jgi:hypothetical protein